MAYTPISFSAFQTLTAAQMNVLAANDASFDTRITANTNAISNSAWTSYTPTWTNVNVSGATQASKYKQIGKIVFVRLSIVLGTASPVSGEITASLPVTRAANGGTGNTTPLGSGIFYDISPAALYPILVGNATTTTVILRAQSANTTYVQQVLTSSTVPFTWDSGDEINATFCYEAA